MIRYETVTDLKNYIPLLQEFFDQVRFGRYLTDYKLDSNQSIALEIDNLNNYLKYGQVLMAIQDDLELIGLIGYHLSQWDTELFLKPYAIISYFLVKEPILYQYIEVARKLLGYFHNWTAENKIATVVVKLDTHNYTPILSIQEEHYQYFECDTFLTTDKIPMIPMSCEVLNFRYAEERDYELLRNLVAKQFFRRSHFFLDPKFPVYKVEQLYAKWIDSALDKKQKFVIIEEQGAVCGLFIYDIVDLTERFGKRYAVWKLADIDSRVRGKGLGMRLFYATIQSGIDNGVDMIDSSLAVHNVASQNIHIKLCFRLITSVYTFHRWFD